MLLAKFDPPGPSFVFVGNETLGRVEMLQTKPFSVSGRPPSFTFAPPDVAVFIVIALIADVVNEGIACVVADASFE